MRFLGGAALVAATMLALTGCGSQATQPSTTPSVTVAPSSVAPPSATPTPTATRTGSATPEPTTTPVELDPNRPKNQCPDDSIGVTVVAADGGGAAGSEEYDVLFTNVGGTPCALRGTPGVSVVGDGNGTQLGLAAMRNEADVKTITLQDGESVVAPLRIVDIGTDGGPLVGCTVQKGDGYRVYPPHSERAFLYKDPKAVACVKGPSFMTVGPVVPRTG